MEHENERNGRNEKEMKENEKMKDPPQKIMKNETFPCARKCKKNGISPISHFNRFGPLRRKNAFSRDSGRARSSGDSEITSEMFTFRGAEKCFLFPFYHFHFCGESPISFILFDFFHFFHFHLPRTPPGADPVPDKSKKRFLHRLRQSEISLCLNRVKNLANAPMRRISGHP